LALTLRICDILMIRMAGVLTNTLVIVGVLFLLASLSIVRRLAGQFPPGKLRQHWSAMGLLVLSFIIGYIGYIALYEHGPAPGTDFIVPSVFLFSAIFIWIAVGLALQTTIDLRRMRLLEEQSITDPLLGVYNRRYLEGRIEEEFARARRYGLPLSILMVDIDHFKAINDTYQHQAGDAVLRHIGRLVVETVRDSDIVARFGGDELVIIAPETTASAAAALAERFRKNVEAQEFLFANAPDSVRRIPLTLSIGVAHLTPDITGTADLIGRADEALHRAKEAGRNRVVVHDAGPGAQES
jgi:diguanylate cyclase (GGDEF)-like protein